MPPAFAPRTSEWLVIPIYHIFGSEELSLVAPAIAERAPTPYVALHPNDAAELHVGPGDEVELILAGTVYRLPVQLKSVLPRRVAGLPAGLPDLQGIMPPAWSRVKALTPLKEAG